MTTFLYLEKVYFNRILKTAFEEELPKEYIFRLFDMRDEIQNSQIPPSLVVKEWAKTIKKNQT